MANLPYALQLYTVREALEKAPEDTLKAVKKAGYDFVETAGTAGRSPRAFKDMLDKAGLTPVSSHIDFNELLRDPASVVDAARTFGVRYLVFSWKADSAADWIDMARRADRAGANLKSDGFQLCYHNHDHEFVAYDGRFAFDIIMSESDPKHLAAELDVYWIRAGGPDPVDYIRKYRGRCPLLHVKDMTATEPHTFAEVGRGIIDMPAVFEAGKAAGVEWYIVEQDTCERDPLESIRISAEYMAEHAK